MWHKKRQYDELWLFCDGGTGTQSGETLPPATAQPVALRKRLRGEMLCTAAAVAWSAEGQLVDWAWRTLPRVTNNEAEYAGLILGLELAHKLGAHTAVCVLDSEVVVGQMEGRFAVHSGRLRQWQWQARTAERLLSTVRYCLVPREWNRLADGLAAQVSVPWAVLKSEVQSPQS